MSLSQSKNGFLGLQGVIILTLDVFSIRKLHLCLLLSNTASLLTRSLIYYRMITFRIACHQSDQLVLKRRNGNKRRASMNLKKRAHSETHDAEWK